MELNSKFNEAVTKINVEGKLANNVVTENREYFADLAETMLTTTMVKLNY